MNFNEQEVKIYSNDKGYFTRLCRKNISEEWETGFFYVKFKKGVSLENKTKIKLKKAWLSFYKSDKDKKDKTVWFVYVDDFEVLGKLTDNEEAEDVIIPGTN